LVSQSCWDQCYNFVNVFAPKTGSNTGYFDSKYLQHMYAQNDHYIAFKEIAILSVATGQNQ
jgi:hypothetical protein